jgi:hypothetical protein
MTLLSGYKTFVNDVVLPAEEINGYLMQGILVFSDASDRDQSLVGNLREGQYAYLKSNKSTYVYTGTGWITVGEQQVAFASTSARDTAFPAPVNGQYAYTTDLNRLWLRSSGAWVQQNASPVAADFSNSATGTYSSGGRSFKFVQFNSNGTLVCTRAGIARVLVVGGGGGGWAGTWNGQGGSVFDGFVFLTAGSHSAVIGGGGTPTGGDSQTAIGSNSTFFGIDGKRGGAGATQQANGTSSDITGTSLNYGRDSASSPVANRGDGGTEAANTPGSAGVVIVRVET